MQYRYGIVWYTVVRYDTVRYCTVRYCDVRITKDTVITKLIRSFELSKNCNKVKFPSVMMRTSKLGNKSREPNIQCIIYIWRIISMYLSPSTLRCSTVP